MEVRREVPGWPLMAPDSLCLSSDELELPPSSGAAGVGEGGRGGKDREGRGVPQEHRTLFGTAASTGDDLL